MKPKLSKKALEIVILVNENIRSLDTKYEQEDMLQAFHTIYKILERHKMHEDEIDKDMGELIKDLLAWGYDFYDIKHSLNRTLKSIQEDIDEESAEVSRMFDSYFTKSKETIH